MRHPAPPRPAGPYSIGRVLSEARVMRPGLTALMSNEPLHQQAAAHFDLLRARRVDFVLVGGLAMLQFVPGSNTVDIDLIMALSDLRRVPELVVEESDANFARCRYGDLVVDLLLTRNRLFDQVLRHHTASRLFAEGEIPCATVEGLLLLKLHALPSLYRQGDFQRVNQYERDIAQLLFDYDPPIAPLSDELARHLSVEDQASVADVIQDLQLRIRRFRSKGAAGPGGLHVD